MKGIAKKITFLSMTALLSASLLACGSGSKGTETMTSSGTSTTGTEFPAMTIKLAGATADTSSQTVGAMKFRDIVKEKTGGKVEVQVFPNLQLGSLREQTEMAQFGSVELSMSLVSTLSTFDENLKVMEFPFLWPTDEAKLWKVADGKAGEQALKSLESKGFHAFGIWAGGYKALTTGEKGPIMSPSDLKGMKFRVIPSPTLIEQYKTWGANPTPVDFAELYTALQSKVVDGQENPLETIATQNHHEVQKNLMIMNHGYQFHMLVANKQWFDGLTPELKQVLTDAEKEARLFARDYNQKKDSEYLKLLKDKGMAEYRLTSEQIKPFADLSVPLQDKLSTTDSMKQLLKTIRDETAASE
jgi:C4-dicarboxylate-binding protein DctP